MSTPCIASLAFSAFNIQSFDGALRISFAPALDGRDSVAASAIGAGLPAGAGAGAAVAGGGELVPDAGELSIATAPATCPAGGATGDAVGDGPAGGGSGTAGGASASAAATVEVSTGVA